MGHWYPWATREYILYNMNYKQVALYYRNIPPESSLPAGLVRGDGQSLPFDLLSEGTKDIFALALRLAMAEFFLSKKKGFLILDDPLVDLDPDRQRRPPACLPTSPPSISSSSSPATPRMLSF